ncbi:hypothetical protein AYO21_06722 [Fonsecaea monophora]|uniref:non-specific serine/threonine protein kinase n=1 Tax=Fonsecaea monophora TaxID=254056 RepID=A0A177F6E4_9EURO|nr:hypothetical protein AYO21_06722 [Fonsecaea monophora]OAG39002.1 hypothetical protein AYO21_06722 [Fonsecaea monophora]
MPGSSISQVRFSFEIHPESHQIMFWDRSRLHTTRIDPDKFREDGNFRKIVLNTKKSDYTISAGGEKLDQFVFHVKWVTKKDMLVQEQENKSQMVDARICNSRWAPTVEDVPMDLTSWYNTRLHTPAIGAVQRAIIVEDLGGGAFGQVYRAVDADSGCSIAAKRIKVPGRDDVLQREVKALSSISHKNIVEYLGSSGWGTETVEIYLSLKSGSLGDLIEQFPGIHTNKVVVWRLWHEMLQALDYLACRNWIHRDVKPANILYTPTGDNNYLFQLADFGLASQQQLARTLCGSPLYMAPEIRFETHEQSPKADVWSLFVVLSIVTQSGNLHDPRLAQYKDVLQGVKDAAIHMPILEPMARQDPDLRASAAQMLAMCFNGEGLTTPRRQISPVPDASSQPSGQRDRLQVPAPKGPKPEVPGLKRLRSVSPKPAAKAPQQPKHCFQTEERRPWARR